MAIFPITTVTWLLLQTAVSTAGTCDYKIKFPYLNGTILTAEENSYISLKFTFYPSCGILETVTVERKNNDGTRHAVCKVVLSNGTCIKPRYGLCSCLEEEGMYQLTKLVELSDNATWVFWVNDDGEKQAEVIFNILPHGLTSDLSATAREPEVQNDGKISTAPDRASEDSTPLPIRDQDGSTTGQSASTLQADAGESSTNSTTIGLGVGVALAALIAVAIFVYDRFWKRKDDQVERLGHLTALIRYCRRKLGRGHTPSVLANQLGNRVSVDHPQSRYQDSPVTRTRRQSKCPSRVPSENIYWEIEPDEIYTLEEVVEDHQREDDDEEAVMIVNSLYAGGDVETKEQPVKLADYEDVADAKGREGETRPVSASQPAAASSASEPGAATEGYIDFNVTLDGDCHTQRETRGRLLTSESGAANGEYVGLSKVLEMNSHQKDEDGKK